MNENPEQPEVDPTLESTRKSTSVAGAVSWLPVIFAVIGILFVRRMAADMDHALANLLTVGILLLGWIFLMVALLISKHRTLAATVLAAPFVAGLVGVAMFRFERLDSELVPQFVPRWQSQAELPEESSETAEDTMFTATERDFPQFMGPARDGKLTTQVDPNWDQAEPEIVWKQPIGEGWSGFATQGDVAVTMEQRGDQEWVSAYSILDGSLLWQFTIVAQHTTVPGGTGPRSTPSIANDRVYACSAVSEVVCLDLLSGKKIWSQDLLELAESNQAEFEKSVAWGRAGSPLVFENRVVVPFGGPPETSQPLVCFAADSGEELWRGGSGQISYSSPSLVTLDGVQQIVMVSEDKVAGYEPTTGKELWSSAWPGKANANPAIAQPVFASSTRLLLGKGYGEGARLLNIQQSDEGWKVETVWKENRVLKTKFTSAVIVSDYAYGLSDGILECVEIATGQQQWKRGRYRHGQLLLLGDHLLISSEAGELVLVQANPESYEELFKLDVISDVSWNTLAVSGDRVLMRNSEQAACVIIPVLKAAQTDTGTGTDPSDGELTE